MKLFLAALLTVFAVAIFAGVFIGVSGVIADKILDWIDKKQ